MHEEDLLEEEDFIANVVDRPISTGGSFHVKLGSKQPPETFDAIEKAHQDDQAFGNFRIKLNDFLNVLLPSSDIPLPDGRRIHLRGNNHVRYPFSVCSLTINVLTYK